jgi:ribonuclease HI
MIPSMLSPSVNKSSVAARAILMGRQESLSAFVIPLKVDEDIIDLCNRFNDGHYRSLILQIHEIPLDGRNQITSGLGWEVYGISLVGSTRKLAEGRFNLSEEYGCSHNEKGIAAYSALIQGLDFLLQNGVSANTLLIESDSKTVINQMTGAAQVHDLNLVKAYGVAKKLESALKYNGACRNIHLQHTSF